MFKFTAMDQMQRPGHDTSREARVRVPFWEPARPGTEPDPYLTQYGQPRPKIGQRIVLLPPIRSVSSNGASDKPGVSRYRPAGQHLFKPAAAPPPASPGVNHPD
jgi:hypothetical protein